MDKVVGSTNPDEIAERLRNARIEENLKRLGYVKPSDFDDKAKEE